MPGCSGTNIYGTRETTPSGRDFTINALYYDPAGETLLDYTTPEDLPRKSVRSSATRAPLPGRPVRMLRAVRFAAKAGFSIDERHSKADTKSWLTCSRTSPVAVYEEMQSCCSRACATGLAPAAQRRPAPRSAAPARRHHRAADGERSSLSRSEQTDSPVRSANHVSPRSCSRPAPLARGARGVEKSAAAGTEPDPSSVRGDGTVLDIQTDKLRHSAPPHRRDEEIWALQPRFEQRSGRRPFPPGAREIPGRFDFCAEERARRRRGTLAMVEKFQHAGEAERQACSWRRSGRAPAAPPRRRSKRRFRRPSRRRLEKAGRGLRGKSDDTGAPRVILSGEADSRCTAFDALALGGHETGFWSCIFRNRPARARGGSLVRASGSADDMVLVKKCCAPSGRIRSPGRSGAFSSDRRRRCLLEPPPLQPLRCARRSDSISSCWRNQVLVPRALRPHDAFLKSETGRKLVRGAADGDRDRVPATCGLAAQETVKRLIQEAAGDCATSGVRRPRRKRREFHHDARWLLTGRRDPFWGLPGAGVAGRKIANAGRFGRALLNGAPG